MRTVIHIRGDKNKLCWTSIKDIKNVGVLNNISMTYQQFFAKKYSSELVCADCKRILKTKTIQLCK